MKRELTWSYDELLPDLYRKKIIFKEMAKSFKGKYKKLLNRISNEFDCLIELELDQIEKEMNKKGIKNE